MYEYKFKLTRVVDGDTIDGIIDLGFNIHHHARVRLAAINEPETRLQKSIRNKKERIAEKQKGLKAKERLKEILKEGSRQPEGLIIKTHLDKKGKYGRVLGEILYIYARDLYNANPDPRTKPWIGWKSVNHQLLAEGIVKPYLL